MENPKYLFAALPIFLVAILAEIFFIVRVQKRVYGWQEALATLGVAAVARPINLFLSGYIIYMATEVSALRWYEFSMERTWHWILAFLVVELSYYCFHRMSHRVRFMWATHTVHHSPNQLRLTAAYRLGWTSLLSAGWLLYFPPVLLGVPPRAVVILMGVNLLYQFWLHTELIPKLGILEYVLNTPSQHRVHHGTNPQYLDKNFGGVLCIYDRLFGTYQVENERPRFGVVPALKTLNPVLIGLHGWIEIIRDIHKVRSARGFLRLIFGPPGAPIESHHDRLRLPPQ